MACRRWTSFLRLASINHVHACRSQRRLLTKRLPPSRWLTTSAMQGRVNVWYLEVNRVDGVSMACRWWTSFLWLASINHVHACPWQLSMSTRVNNMPAAHVMLTTRVNDVPAAHVMPTKRVNDMPAAHVMPQPNVSTTCPQPMSC